jgi:acyl CoA:acetate/3-ketoacid CoA transferase alpha subunit
MADLKARSRNPPRRRHDRHGRWLRALRHPRAAHSRPARHRRPRAHLHLQQRRRRRLGPRPAAADQTDQEDDLELRWGECDIRAQFIDGELEVEFNPQGTLAERIRAGGAGIPAFYTATGAGTLIAQGKETRELVPPRHNARVNAADPHAATREFVLETGLYADLALVKAHKGDEFGNLVYRKTARNFNPMMATAAACVIAEVEEIVPLGSLDPDGVHTPGSFVDRVVRTDSEKRIEQRTVRKA